MSTSTHTPGPWSEPTNSAGRFEVGADRRIAIVDRIEDARLIAAAPDLLRALQRIMTYAHMGASISDVNPREQPQFIDAYAAIAKATGEGA